MKSFKLQKNDLKSWKQWIQLGVLITLGLLVTLGTGFLIAASQPGGYHGIEARFYKGIPTPGSPASKGIMHFGTWSTDHDTAYAGSVKLKSTAWVFELHVPSSD